MRTLSSLLTADTLDASHPILGGFRLKANQLAYWCWCLTLFFIPFSTALGLLMSALAIVSGLLGFSFESFKRTLKQPLVFLCILLFGWLTLSMLWSIAPKAEMLEAWSKYRKLLYPALVLMVLYNLRKGPEGLVNGFLAGCGVVALMSLLSASGILEFFMGAPQVAGGWYLGPGWLFIGGPDNPTFGRNHITQSAFLSFAAMLALGRAWILIRRHVAIVRQAVGWLVTAAAYLIPIFLLQARTGYLLATALFIYWIFLFFRYLEKKQAAICALLTVSVFASLVTISPHILSRTKVLTDSVTKYIGKKEMADNGVRLEFWESGLKIFLKTPTVGVGLGSYAEAYANLDGRPDWLVKNRSQPHSEYILMMVQGGALGCYCFSL